MTSDSFLDYIWPFLALRFSLSSLLVSFSMMLPPLLEVWGRLGLDERTFSCTILKKDGRSPKKMLFAVGVLIPCVIIIICYTLIFIKVRRSRRTIRGHR